MTTIWADFNARTADDRVRLNTLGSARDVAAASTKSGAWVWLSDGEVRVGAVVEEDKHGLVARPAWETAEDIVPPEREIAPSEVVQAHRELRALLDRPDPDYRRMLRLLAVSERGLPPGGADHFRSRATQAFGYPELALLAIEEALRKDPGRSAFIHQRLDLLRTIDLDRAYADAKSLASGPSISALVVASCANIYSAYARRLDADGKAHVERELLALTEKFEQSREREMASPSAAAIVYVTRGFALLHLSKLGMGDREKAIEEFDRALNQHPTCAQALAARGLETYPDGKGIADLERAVALDLPSFWPAYYLTNHYVDAREWSKAAKFADIALRMAPPERVRANLLEWSGIARFESDGDVMAARELLLQAQNLAPDNEHLRTNLAIIDAVGEASSPRAPWRLVLDEEKRTSEVQLAA